MREYLAEGDREKGWSTASAEARRVCHLSHLWTALELNLQTLHMWGGCSRSRECTDTTLIPNAANAMECCPGKTQPENHTWVATGGEDFSKGVLGVWVCSALNVSTIRVQIMHNAWVRHSEPKVCCPSAQSTPEVFRLHLGRRNVITALPQSRSSHLCLSCCLLSSNVPECCQRPSALSPSPRAWENNQLPWKLCISLYSQHPSQDKVKHLQDPAGGRIISQFPPNEQWRKGS